MFQRKGKMRDTPPTVCVDVADSISAANNVIEESAPGISVSVAAIAV